MQTAAAALQQLCLASDRYHCQWQRQMPLEWPQHHHDGDPPDSCHTVLAACWA